MGVDAGHDWVKCASIDDRGRVVGLWRRQLYPERRSRTDSLEGEALQKRLRELMRDCQQENPGWSRSVSALIEGPGSLTGYLQLPEGLSDKELAVAVPSAVQKQIPFPLEETFLTHVSVPPVDPDHKGPAVFFVAARQAMLERQKKLLEACNLDVRRLDVPALCLVREFVRFHNPSEGEVTARVNAGYQQTQVVVMRGRHPYYYRDFDLGGRDFTYAIQVARRCTWSEAEQHKMAGSAQQRDPAVEPALHRWMEEVRRSLDYFSFRLVGTRLPVHRVVLSGGTAGWQGLAQRLEEHLKLPCLVEDWGSARLGRGVSGQDAHFYKLSAGLALSD